MRLSWTTAPISSMQQANLFLATGVAKSLTTTAWLRCRFRMYIWKQWKKPKTKVANLRKLGIPAGQGLPIWTCPITNEKLAQAGYFDFPAHYEFVRKMHLCGWTVVYRSVCTVVCRLAGLLFACILPDCRENNGMVAAYDIGMRDRNKKIPFPFWEKVKIKK